MDDYKYNHEISIPILSLFFILIDGLLIIFKFNLFKYLFMPEPTLNK